MDFLIEMDGMHMNAILISLMHLMIFVLSSMWKHYKADVTKKNQNGEHCIGRTATDRRFSYGSTDYLLGYFKGNLKNKFQQVS